MSALRARILNICKVVTSVHLPCLMMWHTVAGDGGNVLEVAMVQRWCFKGWRWCFKSGDSKAGGVLKVKKTKIAS